MAQTPTPPPAIVRSDTRGPNDRGLAVHPADRVLVAQVQPPRQGGTAQPNNQTLDQQIQGLLRAHPAGLAEGNRYPLRPFDNGKHVIDVTGPGGQKERMGLWLSRDGQSLVAVRQADSNALIERMDTLGPVDPLTAIVRGHNKDVVGTDGTASLNRVIALGVGREASKEKVWFNPDERPVPRIVDINAELAARGLEIVHVKPEGTRAAGNMRLTVTPDTTAAAWIVERGKFKEGSTVQPADSRAKQVPFKQDYYWDITNTALKDATREHAAATGANLALAGYSGRAALTVTREQMANSKLITTFTLPPASAIPNVTVPLATVTPPSAPNPLGNITTLQGLAGLRSRNDFSGIKDDKASYAAISTAIEIADQHMGRYFAAARDPATADAVKADVTKTILAAASEGAIRPGHLVALALYVDERLKNGAADFRSVENARTAARLLYEGDNAGAQKLLTPPAPAAAQRAVTPSAQPADPSTPTTTAPPKPAAAPATPAVNLGSLGVLIPQGTQAGTQQGEVAIYTAAKTAYAMIKGGQIPAADLDRVINQFDPDYRKLLQEVRADRTVDLEKDFSQMMGRRIGGAQAPVPQASGGDLAGRMQQALGFSIPLKDGNPITVKPQQDGPVYTLVQTGNTLELKTAQQLSQLYSGAMTKLYQGMTANGLSDAAATSNLSLITEAGTLVQKAAQESVMGKKPDYGVGGAPIPADLRQAVDALRTGGGAPAANPKP